MTERDILERQEQTGNRQYYLMLVGSFLHAYGHGAFALARLMGYRVVRKQRKGGEVLVTGFPANRLDMLRQRLADCGGLLQQVDTTTWTFEGVDGTPDAALVSTAAPRPAADADAAPAVSTADWLVERVLSFNLSQATPLEAMMFLGCLQQQIRSPLPGGAPQGGLQPISSLAVK